MAFNGDVSNWDTGQVTDMSGMFAHASSFNGDVSKWNTAAVTYMIEMFARLTSLTIPTCKPLQYMYSAPGALN